MNITRICEKLCKIAVNWGSFTLLSLNMRQWKSARTILIGLFFTADLSTLSVAWLPLKERRTEGDRDVGRRGCGQGERCCHGRPRLCSPRIGHHHWRVSVTVRSPYVWQEPNHFLVLGLKRNLNSKVRQWMKWVTSARMNWVDLKTENVNLATVSIIRKVSNDCWFFCLRRGRCEKAESTESSPRLPSGPKPFSSSCCSCDQTCRYWTSEDPNKNCPWDFTKI